MMSGKLDIMNATLANATLANATLAEIAVGVNHRTRSEFRRLTTIHPLEYPRQR